jgi:hypothetical protein
MTRVENCINIDLPGGPLSKLFFTIVSVFFTSLIFIAGCTAPDASKKSTSGQSSGSIQPVGSGPGAGQAFFNSTIVPAFNNSCVSCHKSAASGGTGPLTIYTYTSMRTYLLNGPTTANNYLINKLQNFVTHTGGDQCALSGPLASPCKEVMQWWATEKASAASGIEGNLMVLGGNSLSGWAIDVANPSGGVNVSIYVDGAVGSGTLLTTIQANGNNLNGAGFQQGHSFIYTLPSTYANGTAHTIYAYGNTPSVNSLFPGPAKSLTGFGQSVAGMNYYNNTVKPLLVNKCSRCHIVDYDSQWTYLVSPAPNAGGTATNNTLINKASNTVSHGGGNICGSMSQSPCLEMQTWWHDEFGP